MTRVSVAILLSAMAVVGSVAAIHLDTEPLVIYNPSPSVPQGFYVRLARAPQAGDFVTIASVDVAADYTALRGFADPTDRFIKRIAAVSGQTVCAEGDSVFIDGRLAVVGSRGEDACCPPGPAVARSEPTRSSCSAIPLILSTAATGDRHACKASAARGLVSDSSRSRCSPHRRIEAPAVNDHANQNA